MARVQSNNTHASKSMAHCNVKSAKSLVPWLFLLLICRSTLAFVLIAPSPLLSIRTSMRHRSPAPLIRYSQDDQGYSLSIRPYISPPSRLSVQSNTTQQEGTEILSQNTQQQHHDHTRGSSSRKGLQTIWKLLGFKKNTDSLEHTLADHIADGIDKTASTSKKHNSLSHPLRNESSNFQNNNSSYPTPPTDAVQIKSSNNNNNNNDQSNKIKSSPMIPLTTANVKKESNTLSIAAVANKKPTDPLTLQDLESILLTNRFVRERDMVAWANTSATSNTNRLTTEKRPTSSMQQPSKGSSSSSSSSVAFPQPSLVGGKELQVGIMVAASVLGACVGASLLPSLWLMGGILGGIYGHDLSRPIFLQKEAQQQQPHAMQDVAVMLMDLVDERPGALVARLIILFGRWLASWYLQIYDYFNIFWFLYKTGQLSYEYFKQYEKLDQRFAIQDKLDAWNARFVQGKIKFDKWEKENEVGRKLMATMRTVWLVEEQQQYKRMQKQQKLSKYRVVQLVYYALDSVKAFANDVWQAMTGTDGSHLGEFVKGVKMNMSGTRGVGPRVGAAIAALFALNFIGAIFSLSPIMLSCAAALAGLMWPSWVEELTGRTMRFYEETRARGRGDKTNRRRNWNGHDKNVYGNNIRADGSKRYSLKGKPFPWYVKRTKQTNNNWPWQRTKRETVKEQRAWPFR